MSTVAVREPYMELVPAFERATENKVTTMWVGVSTQNERIKGGEIVDLVIGTASGIDELNKLGHLVSGVAIDPKENSRFLRPSPRCVLHATGRGSGCAG